MEENESRKSAEKNYCNRYNKFTWNEAIYSEILSVACNEKKQEGKVFFIKRPGKIISVKN